MSILSIFLTKDSKYSNEVNSPLESTKILIKDNLNIKLTNKETDLLFLLCQNKNQTVFYETIEAVVWNDSFMSEDAIRSVARNLRKKLPKDCLENFSKIGYKIVTLD